MTNRRVRDVGENVLVVRVDAIDAVCAAGHAWIILRDELMRDAEAARACPVCGLEASDAGIAAKSVQLERRGVVVDLGFGDADA